MKKVLWLLLFSLLLSCWGGKTITVRHDLERARRQQAEGNYRDALAVYRHLLLSPANNLPQEKIPELFDQAVFCLKRLRLEKDFDGLVEEVLKRYPESWRVKAAAAKNYLNICHYGFQIAGKFERGAYRGGGEALRSVARDRARSIQLYYAAMKLMLRSRETSDADKRRFFEDFSRALLYDRTGPQVWRLQLLTSLKTLPDYQRGNLWGGYWYRSPGAPVDEDGQPIFYRLPRSFAAATSDGERWRWVLHQARKYGSRWAEYRLGRFLLRQFGVQTIADYFNPARVVKGVFSLSKLKDDETIARLASGCRRFKLPPWGNYITIFRKLAGGSDKVAEDALNQLAGIYSNRRQYKRAADYWRESIKRFGPGRNNWKQRQLRQLLGNWINFQPVGKFAAGTAIRVRLNYRNTDLVDFSLYRLKRQLYIDEIKSYLAGNPSKLDWRAIMPNRIGEAVEKHKRYLDKLVKKWQLKLNPLPNHFDCSVEVKLPALPAGVYLLQGKAAKGNLENLVIWVTDTVIASHRSGDKQLFYVADAGNGLPVPQAQIEFFGYRVKYLRGKWLKNRRYDVLIDKFRVTTDKHGLVVVPDSRLKAGFSYLKLVNTAGRFAVTGFENILRNSRTQRYESRRRIFGISDCPVYRPGQTVKFKYWLRQVSYLQSPQVNYNNIPVTVVITSPRGEPVWSKTLTTNNYGGLNSSYCLPPDAELGNYTISIKGLGGNLSFRVEEYHKPEFEVKISAPVHPVRLGSKFNFVVRARYYFGEPVRHAKVRYRILRYPSRGTWYPVADWDWLYGNGYWWLGSDADWYPGWQEWGWPAPRRYGCGAAICPPPFSPPEVVAQREADIGPDGTLTVTVDSAIAAKLFGRVDSRYEITAEVMDRSYRTVVGRGSVIAAARPFRICCWTTRGFYRAGDDVTAKVKALTADRHGVKGQGRMTLFLFEGDKNGKVTERPLRQWTLETDNLGDAELRFNVPNPGQYRLEYELKDSRGNFSRGGTIFSVLGDGNRSDKQWHYNALRLVSDRGSYQPGDKLKLLLSSRYRDALVLLFVRAGDGKNLIPEFVKLRGHHAVRSYKITRADMPNFFVTAWLIAEGRVFRVTRRIAVPPEKKVLKLTIVPDKQRYKPGSQARVKLKICDYYGRAVKGRVVVTVYDKAAEYISGGSNVPPIRPFFWKWLRDYYGRDRFSLDGNFYPIPRPPDEIMRNIGVFGGLPAITECDYPAPRGMVSAVLENRVGGSRLLGTGGLRRNKAVLSARPAVVVPVRRNFADTAFWAAELVTDAAGRVELSLKMPENLTTWKIRVWSLASGTRVGEGETEVITSKNFLIREILPPFMVAGDEANFAAVVHNYQPRTKEVELKLTLNGGLLTADNLRPVRVTVPARGERRVEWRVKALRAGKAAVGMSAVSLAPPRSGKGPALVPRPSEGSDAMELQLPIIVHGSIKQLSYSGTLDDSNSVNRAFITLQVPEKSRITSTRLQINYSPTLAAALLEALPSLINSDYGNSEATLNRFLPAVMVLQCLRRIGIEPEMLRRQKGNSKTKGDSGAGVSGMQGGIDGIETLPNREQLRHLVAGSLRRLYAMQNSDGGWGWFSGYAEQSLPDMTARVVRGLLLAADNGCKINQQSLQRGIAWLRFKLQQRLAAVRGGSRVENTDAMMFRVLTQAGCHKSFMTDMGEILYRQRNNLSLYGKTLLALAFVKQKQRDKVNMLQHNIEQYLMQDDDNQTAWLRLPENNCWWRWYGDEYETQAAYLQLLNRLAPGGTVAGRLVKYLLDNRRHATYWNSTRDTAFCLEAIGDYLAVSHELNPELEIEILLDGKLLRREKIDADNLFSVASQLVVRGDKLPPGMHILELRRRGRGRLYFSACLRYFSLAKKITAAGGELAVARNYYRLVAEPGARANVADTRGRAVSVAIEKYRRVALRDGDKIAAGDLIEVELTITSKNDFSYVVLQDAKPAGCAPVDLRSGYNGNALGAYVEFENERVKFFISRLRRGRHSVSYRMRAETPGIFTALPAVATGVYAPKLRANSASFQLKIVK